VIAPSAIATSAKAALVNRPQPSHSSISKHEDYATPYTALRRALDAKLARALFHAGFATLRGFIARPPKHQE
jgi:hypothetical protein